MESNIYSIYDDVAKEFGPPWIAVNDGVAKRQYRAYLVKVLPDQKKEYLMFKLGTFDGSTGRIVTAPPEQIEVEHA